MRLKLGPYGTPHWSKSDRKWVGRLTTEGQQFLELQLAQRRGRPIGLLFENYRKLASLAVRIDGEDAVNQHCRVGFIKATLKFDPARGKAFEALAKSWVRNEVQKNLWLSGFGLTYRDMLSRFRSGTNLPVYLGDPQFDRVEGRSDSLTELAIAHSEHRVKHLLATLTARQCEVVWRRAIEGETLKAIGESWGVTKQRAEQIFRVAQKQLTESLAQSA